MTLTCPNCRSEVRAGARFCDCCGADVAPARQPTSNLESRAGGDPSTPAAIDRRPATAPTPKTDNEFEETVVVKRSPAPPAASTNKPAATLIGGRYEVIAELGRSGFAEVFKAKDRNLERIVAVKHILTQPPDNRAANEIVARFQQEASAIAKLKHRNIVEVYDSNRDDAGYYIVMEFIEGGTLNDYLKRKHKVPVNEAVEFTKGIAQGLHYAHRNKLIHRDLRPGNVMIAQEDGKPVPKIVDFGLAPAGRDWEPSGTGSSRSTPVYLAPEQLQDAKNVDHRADIYSLGKLLYTLVTGEKTQDVLSALIPPPPVLAQIVSKCVHPKPEERYFSVEGLLKDLDSVPVTVAPKIRDTADLIAQNVCPSCGTPNQAADKFCAHCGSGLTSVCPECGKENSVHRSFCTGCGTDIPSFKRAAEALERMIPLYEQKQWSRLQKERELLGKVVLQQPKGANTMAQVNELADDTNDKIRVRDELKEQLDAAVAKDDYKEALEIFDTYQQFLPESELSGELPTKLRLKAFDLQYQETIAQLKKAREDKRLGACRQIAAELQRRKAEFEAARGGKAMVWPEAWVVRFRELEQFDREWKDVEDQLQRLQREAKSAFADQDYDQCIEICRQIEMLSGDAAEIDELCQRAEHIAAELGEKWTAAKAAADREGWREAESACEEILKLQRNNREAATLRHQVRGQMKRQKTMRVAIAVAVVAVVFIGVALAAIRFRSKYQAAQTNATAVFQKRVSTAKDLFAQAKESVTVDSFKTAQLMATSVDELGHVLQDDVYAYLAVEQQTAATALHGEMQQYKNMVDGAAALYATNFRTGQEALEKGVRLVSANPKEAYQALLQGHHKLCALEAPDVGPVLDTEKRSWIVDLRQRIERYALDAVMEFAKTARAAGEAARAGESEIFQEAARKLHSADEAVQRGLIMEGANLAITAGDLFLQSSEIAGQSRKLQSIRDPFLAKINRVDFSVLEKHARDQLAKIRQFREAGERQIEAFDYGAAIASFEAATQSLNQALDYATEQMIREGRTDPLQMKFLKQAKGEFLDAYNNSNVDEIRKYAPSHFQSLQSRVEAAERQLIDKQYVQSTEAYEAARSDLQSAKEAVRQTQESLKQFYSGLDKASGMLVDAEQIFDEPRRRQLCNDVLKLLTDIYQDPLPSVLDAETKTRHESIYSQAKIFIDDPTIFYRKDLEAARNYVAAAQLDVVKQKNPRENVLVALNYLRTATAKGAPANGGNELKAQIFRTQLRFLMDRRGKSEDASPAQLRGWAFLALKEFGGSLAAVTKALEIEGLAAAILPEGLRECCVDEKDPYDKAAQNLWFRLFPNLVKNTLGTEFCFVPPGSFVMGNNDSKFQTEKPAHTVELDQPLYMGRFEVAVADYRDFSQQVLGTALFDDTDVVVSGINYVQAVQYCNWLSKKFNLAPAYSCAKPDEKSSKPEDWRLDITVYSYRLPTEAEWEYACRFLPAGVADSGPVDTAWFGPLANGELLRANAEQMRIHQVKPNYLGLYVLLGNLSELVADWFAAYEDKAAKNPLRLLDTGAQNRNVSRGGDITSLEGEVTPTARKRIHPDIQVPQYLGMRLVLPIPFDQIVSAN